MIYTRSLILLLFALLFSANSNAQSWQWGRGNTCSDADGWGVATDQLGNVYMAAINQGGRPAVFGSYKLANPGGNIYQCVLAKYDMNGNFLWAKGTQNATTYLMNITTDINNNVLMFGAFSSRSVQLDTLTLIKPSATDTQYFLAKFDPSGNVIWAKNAGSAQGGYIYVAGFAYVLSTGAIATDPSGNIFITCNYHKPAITIGTNTLTNSNPSGTTDDILLAKYDPSGNVVWAKSYGGDSSDNAYGLTVTPAGDIYIAGIFRSPSITFGPSVISNPSPGSLAFIARFDVNGNAVWAAGSGGMGGEYAVGLTADASNNVYLTGGFKDTAISFNNTFIANTGSGKPVLYLVKFDPSNNVSWYKTIHSVSDTDLGTWGYSIAMSVCGTVWVSGIMAGKVNIDNNILSVPPASCDPVYIAGYSSAGSYIGSAALQSGGDDQTGVACDGKGNVYLCSDFACAPFVVGSDTFKTAIENDTATGCVGGGELMYVAKYSTLNTENREYKVTNKVICGGASTTLNAPDGYKSYLWNDGSTGPTHSVSDSITCWVYANNDCSSSLVDTFKITVTCDCGKTLFLPNSFTPNGDGQNDIFFPRAGYGMKIIRSFRIYNRWGELLFERSNIMANDVSNAWDGSFQGNVPLPDVYIWVVEAVCENDKVVSKKGSVTVIR